MYTSLYFEVDIQRGIIQQASTENNKFCYPTLKTIKAKEGSEK